MRKIKWLAGTLAVALFLSMPMAGLAANEWAKEALWVGIDGSTATEPLTEAIGQYFGRPGIGGQHNTTPDAYENLCSRVASVIFVTTPAPEDLAIAQEAGVELEVIPVVREALVLLNNTENPVSSLTQAQLRDIYTGKITNWKEVGGEDALIMPYQRDTRSGSQSVFLQTLMKDTPPKPPLKDLLTDSMGRLIDQISSYDNAKNALGYSMYYYVTRMYTSATLRVLAVDGVQPSAETIASGEYPLGTHYYAVLRKDTPEDAPERALIRWLLSEEGQRVAVQAGYVAMEESK